MNKRSLTADSVHVCKCSSHARDYIDSECMHEATLSQVVDFYLLLFLDCLSWSYIFASEKPGAQVLGPVAWLQRIGDVGTPGTCLVREVVFDEVD
jgi:hypothetical protein